MGSPEHPQGGLQDEVTRSSSLRLSWLCRDEGEHLHLQPSQVIGAKAPQGCGAGGLLEKRTPLGGAGKEHRVRVRQFWAHSFGPFPG